MSNPISRLKWQTGSIEGWFVAHPIEGDTRYQTSIHKASGRTQGPQWIWNVRYGMGSGRLASGVTSTKQQAADAANGAWERLIAQFG